MRASAKNLQHGSAPKPRPAENIESIAPHTRFHAQRPAPQGRPRTVTTEMVMARWPMAALGHPIDVRSMSPAWNRSAAAHPLVSFVVTILFGWRMGGLRCSNIHQLVIYFEPSNQSCRLYVLSVLGGILWDVALYSAFSQSAINQSASDLKNEATSL